MIPPYCYWKVQSEVSAWACMAVVLHGRRRESLDLICACVFTAGNSQNAVGGRRVFLFCFLSNGSFTRIFFVSKEECSSISIGI